MSDQETSPTMRRVRHVLHFLAYTGAFWLAAGPTNSTTSKVIIVALWIWVGLKLFAAYIPLGTCWLSQKGTEASKKLWERWRAEVGWWWRFRRGVFYIALAALLWSGQLTLAGLWFSADLFWIAAITYWRFAEVIEDDYVVASLEATDLTTVLEDLAKNLKDFALSLFQLAMVALWVVLFIPVVVGAIPLFLLLLPFVFAILWVTQNGLTWTAREFKKAEGMPEGMIYFVYSELHQHAHFLDEPGVLAHFHERVVARNWRALPSADSENNGDTLEAQLLGHFHITSLRKHLPFIAIINRRSRVKSFPCNDAYRARVLDGGVSLQALEEKIRAAAARAFPDHAPSPKP